MRPRTLIAIAVLLAVFPLTGESLAATSVRVRVSATVLPWVSVTAMPNVKSYQVRAEDIRRGYLDLPAALTVTLRSNVRRQIVVTFRNGGPGRMMLRERGVGTFAEHAPVVDPARHGNGEAVAVTFDVRLLLESEVREDVYPLDITIVPIL